MDLDIPVEFWQRHRLVPIGQENGRITVGVDESTPMEVLEDVRLTLNKDVRPVRMSAEEIDDALRRLVLSADSPGIEEDDEEGSVSLDASSDLMGDAAGAPVVRLINSMFLRAMQKKMASVEFSNVREVPQCRKLQQ